MGHHVSRLPKRLEDLDVGLLVDVRDDVLHGVHHVVELPGIKLVAVFRQWMCLNASWVYSIPRAAIVSTNVPIHGRPIRPAHVHVVPALPRRAEVLAIELVANATMISKCRKARGLGCLAFALRGRSTRESCVGDRSYALGRFGGCRCRRRCSVGGRSSTLGRSGGCRRRGRCNVGGCSSTLGRSVRRR